ncbi:MAG: phosphoribosylanthranilate isomerase [Methanolinea sp.]|nr:phosphoribosylanthranilate isomerase [Methanolinea sp.]
MAGADAIGVVLFSDSPRCVNMEEAEEIFASTGPYIARVCVSHSRSQEALAAMLSLRPDAVQVPSSLAITRPFPARVIRMMGPGDPVPPDADAIIIDGSHGKGLTYDPMTAETAVRSASVPVILAGGLNPGNVAEAIGRIRPYAVDVATGVESAPGKKDEAKVREFIRNARSVSP